MKLKKMMIFIYLFYIIYMPRFFKSESLIFSNYAISIALLCVMIFPYIIKVDMKFFKMLLNKKIIVLIGGICLSAAYFAIRAAFKGITDLENLRIVQNSMPIVYILHILIIIDKLKKCDFDVDEGIDFLLKVAALQGIICVIMLLIPSLKDLADKLYLNCTSKFSAGDYILTTRIYGISSDYTFGLPIIHGILSGICFYLAILKDKKYFIYFPFIIAVSVLNSRTGVLVAIISIFISILYYIVKCQKLVKLIYILVGAIIIVSIFIIAIYMINSNILSFISILFDELIVFIMNGEKTGTIEYLLDTNFYLPEGISLLFGEGHRVYGEMASAYGYEATDVGYVNDIFMGGIIYIFILYGAFTKFIFGKTKKKRVFLIKTLIFVGLIIANLKGQVFVNSTFITCILFITCMYIFLEEREKKDEERNPSICNNVSI